MPLVVPAVVVNDHDSVRWSIIVPSDAGTSPGKTVDMSASATVPKSGYALAAGASAKTNAHAKTNKLHLLGPTLADRYILTIFWCPPFTVHEPTRDAFAVSRHYG